MFVLLVLIPQFFLRAHPYDMALSLKGGTSTLYLQFPLVYHHFPQTKSIEHLGTIIRETY